MNAQWIQFPNLKVQNKPKPKIYGGHAIKINQATIPHLLMFK